MSSGSTHKIEALDSTSMEVEVVLGDRVQALAGPGEVCAIWRDDGPRLQEPSKGEKTWTYSRGETTQRDSAQ